jgi:histidine triad (HIT) family protein
VPDSVCIFCKIVAGEIPADIVAESDSAIAFRDISPQAPVHVLVIPREHHATLADMLAAGADITGVFNLATSVASAEGVADSGYRLVVNTNADANQTVFHLHVHVIGGRVMAWPPG